MPAPFHGSLVPVNSKHTDRPPGERWLILAEAVLSRLAAEENLPECDDGGAEAELELDIAYSEISQALVETCRSLKHFHVLRVEHAATSFRSGYREGVRATGLVCNALARDLPGGSCSQTDS